MQKYVAPSGKRESWMRIIPGVMNAAKTFHRGHAPAEAREADAARAEALARCCPATSMRIMWNGTPSAPGRRSVVKRWQTCSKPTRKRRPMTSMS